MSRNRMTEQTFFVLAALIDTPLHGYGIVGKVIELSQGRVQLKVATLYGALDRLVRDQLIEPDHEEVVQGRLRRYYRLTNDGRNALTTEAQRQAANARTVEDRLRSWRPAGGTT